MTTLRIATRGSQLALVQARWVAARVEARLGLTVELVTVRTSGDRLRDVSLARFGGKGLFVKEIEEALLAGRADLAVHSAKDLPAQRPRELALVAFPKRADPSDAVVCRRRAERLDTLPRGARVGTSSLRRSVQLRSLRRDLHIEPLRGNVNTRLRRLESGDFDALVLASAGLDRLGLAERVDERLAPERMLPAVGQGALALETRAEHPLAERLAELGDPVTTEAVAAERAFLEALGGDCNTPLGAFAEREGEYVVLRAFLADPAGARVLRARALNSDAVSAGRDAARAILERGGAEILAELRGEKAP